jgi:hypothetical protein
MVIDYLRQQTERLTMGRDTGSYIGRERLTPIDRG